MCKNGRDLKELLFMGCVAHLLGEASIKDVQAHLGHTDIQTTINIYAHVTKEENKDKADKFKQFMEN